ncbi:MAG: hypothetical protein K6A43_08075 [Treponema sp.]|nr:hypothetical protein [Treponema sp.]
MQNIHGNLFYKKINNLYAQIIAEKNPQDKRNLEQKLIVEVWNQTKRKNKNAPETEWELHADIVTATIKKCLAPDSKFDRTKSTFSQYLLKSIKKNINKAIKNENKKKSKDTPLEQQNDNGESYFLPDIITHTNPEIMITEIQKVLMIEELRDDFNKIENAFLQEKENQAAKSTFITRDIIYILKKQASDLLKDEKIFLLGNKYSFLEKKLWNNYFFVSDELPTQELLAASMGIKKSNASKMISRFYQRLKNF